MTTVSDSLSHSHEWHIPRCVLNKVGAQIITTDRQLWPRSHKEWNPRYGAPYWNKTLRISWPQPRDASLPTRWIPVLTTRLSTGHEGDAAMLVTISRTDWKLQLVNRKRSVYSLQTSTQWFCWHILDMIQSQIWFWLSTAGQKKTVNESIGKDLFTPRNQTVASWCFLVIQHSDED